MSNSTANTQTTNIVPVQGTFEPLPPYDCISLIGPAGTPFFAPVSPILDGVTITNSTINSTTIGATSATTGAFTTATATNAPSGNNDLCNKIYVDSLAVGLQWKQPVNAATTVNITLSGAQTIDTVSVVAGDRVLVKNQTNAYDNGIYVAASGAWSRSTDADTWNELVSAIVFVEYGTQGGSAWYCYAQPGGTLGVTAVPWSNLAVSGVYFAGTGLNLVGNTFSIADTTVSAATYGSASTVPVFDVNAQGQLTSVSNTSIAIGGAAITSGTINTARISGDYTGITAVGTLSGLTVSSTIVGSISGNAATATLATTAGAATNLSGGTTGALPYQSGAGSTIFLSAGTNGQVLTLTGGVPTWAAPPAGSGTVTSVGTAGTVNGLTLTGGPITSSGTITLGGTLNLSSPPAIGATAPAAISGTTITATTKFVGSTFEAINSAGGALQNASGTTQLQWGSGGGSNVSIGVSTNMNGANAQIDISPTGTGHVHIKPTGAGSIEVAPSALGTINNMSIGQTTAAAGSFTNLGVSGTISLAGTTGTAGYVLTSNGASAPTWQVNSNGVTITDDTTTNATRYITFSELTAGTETTLDVASTKLQFNPSTGALTATSLTPTNALGTAYGGTGLTSLGTGVATWLGTPSSANLAAAVTDETGSGSLVFATSPSLTTPNIGAATATSVNGLTISSSTGTLTITNGKTLSASNTLTLAGTDSTTMTFPSTSQTIAGLGLAQTFTAAQTFRAANAIRSEAASTQDAIVIAGRAGGTSSYALTVTPATLSASRTVTLPDPGANYTVGFRNIPQSGSDKTSSYTLTVDDIGEFVGVGTGGSITIPNSTFAAGDAVSIFNNTTGNITITCTITTAYIAGTDTDKATVTLATRGVCTVLFISGTVCVLTGNVS